MMADSEYNEQRRHGFEVAYVAALPDHAARARYLALVAAARGQAADERLGLAACAILQARRC